jgi:hypothetical protein
MIPAGVFLLSLALLLYELCLTRVLSVVFYYHTAFLAISVALLGLGAGGIWVHLSRRPRSVRRLAALAAVAMVPLPVLLPVLQPGLDLVERQAGIAFAGVLGAHALFAFLPFLFGGAALATIFSAHRARVGRLYAADLAGAAAGALLLVPAMESLGGPAALLFCAVIAAGSTLALGVRGAGALALAAACSVLVTAQVVLDPFSPRVDLGEEEGPSKVLYTKWNAFSRIALLEGPRWDRGLSARRLKALGEGRPDQRVALIDINAYAPYLRFDGDLESVAWLRGHVGNLAYRLRPPGARVAIIGPGGGKDVLGALLFDAAEVHGFELTTIIVEDLGRGLLRDYTGDLYGHPRVRIEVGEGRTALAASEERYDVIVMNSVATWAAHSGGAMNLTEASLFTEEAARLYLDRLRPGGILSISLWDDERHALPRRWIATVGANRDRVAAVGNRWTDSRWYTTVLVSKEPFTAAQRTTLRSIAGTEGFDVIALPDRPEERLDLSPATDDRPFFFYTLRGGDMLRFWAPEMRSENVALFSLVVSLLVVAVLTAAAIGVPLLIARIRRGDPGLTGRAVLYFAAIGAGFMVVEISAIQRLTPYLGHPTRSLTVVVFGLLMFAGLGSRWADRWAHGEQVATRLRRVLLALVVLLLAGRWLPPALLLVLLAPLGVLMGTAMPAALAVVGRRGPGAIPFAWGVNGATGVLASVLVILFAIAFGFVAAWTVGAACYLVAAIARP